MRKKIDPIEQQSRKIREFLDSDIIPNESVLAAGGNPAHELAKELTRKAKLHGIFGSFYPGETGSDTKRLTDYLALGEQESRSEYSPAILGADATLDAHMLFKYAGQSVRKAFLLPLLRGEVVSAYAMSEPDGAGSIPATMKFRATYRNGYWHLEGRKWFVCRSVNANFVTVVARTADDDVRNSLSMFVVPADSPGFTAARSIPILGRELGQGEIVFNDVRIPEDHLLGALGAGSFLMRQRLSLGRLLRSIRWIGLAQRCHDLMCERIHSPRGQLARLSEKQLVREKVYRVYRGIHGARCLLRDAAVKHDAGIPNMIEVNVVKMAASDALSDAVDGAIQVFGAEGVADWNPLSGIYREARTTHILDGADDVLVSSVGRQLLAASYPGLAFDPVRPSVALADDGGGQDVG